MSEVNFGLKKFDSDWEIYISYVAPLILFVMIGYPFPLPLPF